MSPSNRTFPRFVVIGALSIAGLFACGPFFGIQALRNRKEFLLAPPSISFETELKSLVDAGGDNFAVVESAPGDPGQVNRAALEDRELSPADSAHVKDMMAQSDGNAAFALGKELPLPIQLYTAGAVSFLHGQTELARVHFQNVLSLPPDERKTRELWARFMLGRIAVQQGNQPDAAVQFQAVRDLVKQGTPDPLGLAVASFGEQARGAWKQSHVANAIALYARQASYGSQSGANSLVMVAGLILNDNNLLDQAVQDPITLRLLFICLNGNSGRPFFFAPSPNSDASSRIDHVVSALQAHGLTRVAGAGLLSAAAYSQGRFDLAQKLAALEEAPMSAWVMGKLALRAGDRNTALKHYEKAIQTYQPSLGNPTPMRTELAVLRVSRGDYVQALDLFYRAAAKDWGSTFRSIIFANYWGDAAYLAERVLTLDELQEYINHKIPVSSGSDSDSKSERSRLRSILARRLMRTGRRKEALLYFDDQKTRTAAEQYVAAIDRAKSWWPTRLARAESWFTAARLARNNGIRILAFELEPDFAIWDGQLAWFESSGSPRPADPYESDDERRRAKGSKPQRDVRFQYRLTAVDEAMSSADLLPKQSQAFAAVLCESTRWVIDRQPEQAAQIYRRYLQQGAHVVWGRDFGRSCPQPDFAAASIWSTAGRQVTSLPRHARAHRLAAGLLAVLVVALLAGLANYLGVRRRRRMVVDESDL